jgi:hypothetical protein
MAKFKWFGKRGDNGGPWFQNWFDPVFTKVALAVHSLKHQGATWHPCADLYYYPKDDLFITKEEWDRIP